MNNPQFDPKVLMRSLPLVAGILGRQYNVDVKIGGATASTDGKTIYLPTLPLDCNSKLLMLARGYIDHEAGHIRETDFAAMRATNMSPLCRTLFNILEDWRIEKRLAEIFPGCRKNMEDLVHHIFLDDADQVDTKNPANNILNWFLLSVRAWEYPAIAARRDECHAAVEMFFHGLSPQLEPHLAFARANCASPQDCITWAEKVERFLRQYLARNSKHESGKDEDDDCDSEERKQEPQNQDANSSGQQQPSPSGSQANQDFSDSEPENEETSAEQSDKQNGDASSYSPSEVTASDSDKEVPDQEDESSTNSALSEEICQALEKLLNADINELPKDLGDKLSTTLESASRNCPREQELIVAVPTRQNIPPLPQDLLDSTRGTTRALASRLHGLLQTLTMQRRCNSRRGKLDGSRLQRLAVNNPRVFVRETQKQGIDTAVHILLDCSTSMSSIMTLASSACYAVAAALAPIRDVSLAVTLFPGNVYHTDNSVTPILTPGQKLHHNFMAHSCGSTPMGEALWWVMQQMVHLPENRKIILMLTDGEPDSYQNTLAAIQTGQRLGLEIHGIGIGEHASKLLHLLPGSPMVKTIEELAPAMFAILQDALTGRRQQRN